MLTLIARAEHVRLDGREAIVELAFGTMAAAALIRHIHHLRRVEVDLVRGNTNEGAVALVGGVNDDVEVADKFIIETPDGCECGKNGAGETGE